MIKHNQDGAVSGLGLSLGLTVFLLICALGFAGWAYSSRQDYKTNSDSKSAAAAQVAVQKESAVKDAAFVETSKNPLATYHGPQDDGSVVLQYPKTWSAYVDDSGKGNTLVDAYFAPAIVPSIGDGSSVFSLRMQVLSQSYVQALQPYLNQQKRAAITISAYALPKLPKIVGVEITGTLTDKSTVTMVLLPLRAQTIQIWTPGSQFVGDFNKYILPNFSFSP